MDRKQTILFASIFAAIAAVLLTGYFLFVRESFVPLYQDLREEDAAQIVTELDRLGIEHQLADGGHAILVAEGALDEAHVAIAGSDIAVGGVVGFELFNDSDMGLTDFAQQVNYQRAIQGELARTIMMMEGIKFARVHVSLPERALFRGEEAGPRAAVTLETLPGERLSDARVRGIQRLVASSVSELQPGDVAVLDAAGELVSPEAFGGTETAAPLDEKSALEAYYRARAEAAASPFLSGVNFAVRVSAVRLNQAPRTSASSEAEASETAARQSSPSQSTPSRDFNLQIAVRTPFEIAQADRDAIGEAIGTAVSLETSLGDTILFEVADPAVTPAVPGWPEGASEQNGRNTASTTQPTVAGTPNWLAELLFSRWILLLGLVVAVVTIPLWRSRRRMSAEERQDFVAQLDAMLAQRQDGEHA